MLDEFLEMQRQVTKMAIRICHAKDEDLKTTRQAEVIIRNTANKKTRERLRKTITTYVNQGFIGMDDLNFVKTEYAKIRSGNEPNRTPN